MDEIPEALREQPKPEQASRRTPGLFIGGILGLGVLLLSVFFWLRFASDSNSVSSTVTSVPEPEVSESESGTEPPESPPEEVDNILGHLTYTEAPEAELEAVTTDGGVRLRSAAAEKFRQMRLAARSEGINLAPLSGYRSVAEQEYIFFGVKEQRGQVASKRAEVSAPPGHSEHHTGYAIDIGDEGTPTTNLSQSFEQTAAFRWLEQNAPRYSFELSFPRDNPQGISYEPWHWRFVGDSDSLNTFYKARQLQPTFNADDQQPK